MPSVGFNMTERTFSKFLLVNPPTGLYRRDDRCQCTVEDQTVQVVFPPMDLALAAACAEREGAVCRIEDYPAAGRGWDAFLSDIEEFKPDVLVVNSTTATMEGDLQTCFLAKEKFPGILTVARGETLVVNASTVLIDHPELDVVLPNEAEEAVGEFAAGHPFCAIKGLHFRSDLLERVGEAPASTLVEPGGKAQMSARKARTLPPETPAAIVAGAAARHVYFTGRRELQPDLDSLPFPARHLLRNDLYRSPETGNPLTVIHGNRGCPAKCIYCPAGVLTDFTVRLRKPERLVAELQECVERYGIREFLFHGDTFTINKRWLKELCDGIEAAKLDIHWGCNSRVDTMDDERAQMMKRAGCWVVAFGIEHGDQMMLDKMKKNATVEQAREAVACCKRNGLRVHCFMVIGLPWETEETLNTTFRFLKELDPDFFDFNLATPLPGTELHQIALKEGLFEADYDAARAGYATGGMRTLSGMSSADLVRWRQRHLLKLYLRPGYITRMLTRAGGARNTMHYFKAGTKRLWQLTAGRKPSSAPETADA
ncbi:MAG: anaerobic magnesium-protoporphyrin monomethyl ester cyclase [Candidatus Sumerlaeota bacterium]|nr:anaerobic magnesium-protoporphyrin monomethyl ester cyclase [Candidatus Sumerlaeota bacterium]